jgi:hypothetical protein
VYSLAHAVLYKIDYWQYDVALLLNVGMGLLALMWIAFGIELGERGWSLRQSPGMLTFMLMFIPAVTCSLQHFIVGSPFLIYRTALFLLPIFMLALVWLLRTTAKVPEFRKPVIVVSVVLTLLLGLQNYNALNLSHCAEWVTDADTDTMLEDLAADRAARSIQGPTTLGISWQLRPAANYYRIHTHLDWLPELTQAGCQPGMDYYFVLNHGEGCALPKAQLPFGPNQGCTLLKTYPISNTELWRGPMKAE